MHIRGGFAAKTTTLTVYDKTFQLMEEELLEDYDAPMLRFEVSRSGAKFKRGLSEQVKGQQQENPENCHGRG